MNAVQLLKRDHKEVAALFEEFKEAEESDKPAIAEQICQRLTVHARIEEELLYPAAREALAEEDEDLVDEAAVEHATVKELLSQIEAGSESDELYEAKVKVLGEYVTHHVNEEERELFPRLAETDFDLEALGESLARRKGELLGAHEDA